MLLCHQAIGWRSRTLTWQTDFKLETYYTCAYTINNRIPAPPLVAVLERARDTVDSTYYTHHTSPSTVEANRAILLRYCPARRSHPLLRRQHDGPHKTRHLPRRHPLTNITGTVPDPLNVLLSTTFNFPAPNTSAVGVGGGPASGLDINFTATSTPSPVNLSA
ncbi:hypothetical protein EDB87DRAFT_1684986 [Lactarius vividus]|nr:hypothetical protein EDB87DRAFT_1684986 [Lactarius vividus]